jgi:hypothetical protein
MFVYLIYVNHYLILKVVNIRVLIQNILCTMIELSYVNIKKLIKKKYLLMVKMLSLVQ